MVFVNSMSELFHKQVDRRFVDRVLDTMDETTWHVYQILTRRSSLMRHHVRERYRDGEVPGHILLGTSVEGAARKRRIDHLRQIDSKARFISYEPLPGPSHHRTAGWLRAALVCG